MALMGTGYIFHMSILKRRLNRVVRFGDALLPEEKETRPDYSALQNLRSQIKQRLSLPVAQLCRTKPGFDPKHGLVYKILRTDPHRLRNSTLCAHDVSFWLRDHKHPSAALWVVKLAGPQYGAVSRNQLLKWLKEHEHFDVMQTVYKWTKKWGFKDTERTRSIVAQPKSVNEAREMYRSTRHNSPESRRIYGNKLLGEVAALTDADPAEVISFFRSLNKDIVGFQVILGAMIKNSQLRSYLQEIWDLAQRQHDANNIRIDEKLQETYERVKKLSAADISKSHDTDIGESHDSGISDVKL